MRGLAGERAVLAVLVLLVAAVVGMAWWQDGQATASGSPAPATSRSPSPSPSSSRSTSPSASPSPSPAPAVVLRLGWTDTPLSLDPFATGPLSGDLAAREVWRLNYDTLVGVGADGLPSRETGLARDWDSADGGAAWKFRLRPHLRWQDGETLTAADVAFTYTYIIDNDLDGATLLKGVSRVEAVGDTTVKVFCERPKADMLLAAAQIYVVPEHVWADVDPDEAAGAYDNEPPIVGSGPFQTVEFERGGFVRLRRNGAYWGAQPSAEEVVFLSYTDADLMLQDLRRGHIDGVQAVPPGEFEGLGKVAGVKTVAYPLYNWEYVAVNCFQGQTSRGAPELRKARFRRALAWAIDRAQCADVWKGYAQPGAGIYPPGGWPASADPFFEPAPGTAIGFDPARAGRILDKAGYKDTDDDGVRESDGKDIKLRLWVQDGSDQNDAQGELIAGWLRDIGLKVAYDVKQPAELLARMYNVETVTVPKVTLGPGGLPVVTSTTVDAFAPDYDLVVRSAGGSIDPGQTAARYTTGRIGGSNDLAWSDKDYDDLNTRQVKEMDGQKRLDLLRRMQQRMYDRQPMIVLDYPSLLQAVDTAGWRGWQPFAQGSVWHNALDRASYLALEPQDTTGEGEGGVSRLTLYLAGGAAVVIVVLVLWLALRPRRPSAAV